MITQAINEFIVAGAAPPLYGTHAYWRVFCTNNHGGTSYINIAEVVFRDHDGNAIATSGGTVIKSSEVVSNEASLVFDGNVATSWLGNGTTNQWVGYHFASAVAVEQVTLQVCDHGTDPIGRSPKDCILQYSDDGSAWSDAFSFVNVWPVESAAKTYPLAAPASGYHYAWRVFCVNNNGGTSGILVREIELRATAGGADQTANVGADPGTASGRVIKSTEFASDEAWRAYDNTSGLWFSNGTTNQYNGFVFPSPVKVEEITLQAHTSNMTRMVKDAHLDYSDDDGATWTTQKTFASQTGWAAGEIRTLTAI